MNVQWIKYPLWICDHIIIPYDASSVNRSIASAVVILIYDTGMLWSQHYCQYLSSQSSHRGAWLWCSPLKVSRLPPEWSPLRPGENTDDIFISMKCIKNKIIWLFLYKNLPLVQEIDWCQAVYWTVTNDNRHCRQYAALGISGLTN